MSDNTSLVRRQLEESLQGSLKDLMAADETVFLLIDTSGSMCSRMNNGKRRIDGLREVVGGITGVPMIAFGGPYDAQVRFVDSVPDPDGGTPLHSAIPLAKQYGATRVVVISDGMPDLQEECLTQARLFGGKIDVVFVGNPGESGSFFLDQLAKITGGARHEGNLAEVKSITSMVIGLLEGATEERGPIQGPGFTADDAPVVADEDDEDDEDGDDDEDEDGDDE